MGDGRGRGQEIVVVGGGLVGSLLAIFLSRRGHRVEVYERRGDMRESRPEAGRSINLVLTVRGIEALGRVKLAERALALSVPVTGRRIHPLRGETVRQPYGRDDSECNYSISRSELNRFLIEEAERSGVRFVFDARLVAIERGGGTLRFAAEGGVETTVSADAVFAADGAGSAAREALGADGGIEQSVALLDHGYKELLIPASPSGDYVADEHSLHIWPRGERMLMALPNRDGSFTVTLYLPHRSRGGFETIVDGKGVLALFEAEFPDAIPLISDLERSFFENPTGNLGTVRCRPWHAGGRLLLIGDAAHAIVPFFGQGMNSGFEDCVVLDDLLEEGVPGEWDALFCEFERRRKPNTDAIADMALENFVEMRDRVGDRQFLLRKEVEHVLEQAMPREYRSRYSMVMYSTIPYRDAMEAGRVQQEILDELCRGLERVEALDLERARALVRRDLAPFLERRGVDLDY